jgi:cytochrome c-type biogenesis protein CcmF
MFPVISEAITGSKITVSAPFFNMVMTPIGLLLLFMTGVGPLLAWRKTSGKSLRKHFTLSSIFGLLCGVVLFLAGVRDVYGMISFVLCGFVLGTIASEFHRGAKARGSSSGEGYLTAVWNLTGRNRRRYGGYIVHFGIVLLFVGFTGNVFNQEVETSLKYGESVEVAGYRLEYEGYTESQNPLTMVIETQLGVYAGEERLGTMWPEQHIYYKRQDQQRTTEVAIRSTAREDLYVLYEGQDEEGSAFFRVYVNPLVVWVWIGAYVLTFGTIVTMWPDRRDKIRRRRISGIPATIEGKISA